MKIDLNELIAVSNASEIRLILDIQKRVDYFRKENHPLKFLWTKKKK